MGYRLPLDSLPWVAPRTIATSSRPVRAARRRSPPRRRRCAPPQARARRQSRRRGVGARAAPRAGADAACPARRARRRAIVRTALVRRSRATAVLLRLHAAGRARWRTTSTCVAAVEDTAAELGDAGACSKATRRRAIRACSMLQVTPDPGVIEVNIHPAHSWARAGRAHRRSLYEEARQSRLATEKFMLDGRHTGTGGGNHVVLGGADAGRQPVPAPARPAAQPARATGTTIRRCRTCSRACSSARPARRRASTRRATTALRARDRLRADAAAASDGRHAAVAGRPHASATCSIDVTGNTHRAEFCIDKLYSPDSSTGRLGLLELRAFEMPPHARMSLAQQLLLRALVARFWQTAVHGARWCAGAPSCTTASCCRTSSGRISTTCIDELRQRRLSRSTPSGSRRTSSSASRWSARSHDARRASSSCARRSSRGTCWARKARPAARRATSIRRSSALQVQGDRPRPTRATSSPATAGACRCSRPARVGEFVAGVRYRAWQPPSALHPTHRRARAADVRPRRHLDEPLARRLPVPRRASGRPQLRHLPGQRLRGREPPPRALLRASATRPGTMRASPPPRARSREFPFTLDLRR